MKAQRTKVIWSEVAVSGSALGLLALAFWMRSADMKIASIILFGVGSAFGLIAWLVNLKCYRLIHSTPTSRIASASQGYVKLAGYAADFPSRLLISPLTGTECVWYRCRLPGSGKHDFEEVESNAPFLLIDFGGQDPCVIEPAGAKIFSLRRTEWRRPERKTIWSSEPEPPPLKIGVNHNLVFVNSYQGFSGDDDSTDNFEERLLLPGDPIHAFGYFISGEVGHGEAHIKADITQRLSTWKEDARNLLERFDLNGDRQLDEREWQLARSAARREVLREHAANTIRLSTTSALSPHGWASVFVGYNTCTIARLALFIFGTD